MMCVTGGGFALSDASLKSGLSAWLGTQLAGLSSLPPFLIMFIVIIYYLRFGSSIKFDFFYI